jgi:hypothetical protein
VSLATRDELRAALDDAYVLIGRLSSELAKARGITLTELAAEVVTWGTHAAPPRPPRT